jgi:Ion channel
LDYSIPATAVLALTDTAIFIKTIAFGSENYWLLRYGPAISVHLSHTDEERAVDMDRIETRGLARCGKCKFVIPARRRIGGHFSTTETMGSWRGIASRLAYYCWSTPIFVLLSGILLIVLSRHAAPVDSIIGGTLTTAVVVLTLLAALILRMSLGPNDIYYSDLRAFIGPFQSRLSVGAGANEGVKEGLIAYFLGLVLISVFGYAVAYNCLFTSSHGQAFHVAGGVTQGDSFETWVYFSVVTAATVGYGDIYPATWVGQLAVVAQIATGPLLLSWLLGVILSDK